MENIQNIDKIKDYKTVSFKLGLMMTVFFMSMAVCSFIVRWIYADYTDELGVTSAYILRLVMSVIFLYLIPSGAGLLIFRQSKIGLWYKKPARLAKAIGNFPAVYGLGQLTNFLALFIMWIYSVTRSLSIEQETLERSFAPMESLFPPNIYCAIALFVYAVFAAAIFEEFMCRGIMLDALKPYGNGFAIIITGFLFGIMHGNFHQFSYAFVVGIVLAYITIQTGTILAATILHALFNSIASVMMLFFSTKTIQDFMFNEYTVQQTESAVSDTNMMLIAAYAMFLAFFIGLLVGGIVLALRRISRIKQYTRAIDNPFPEISAAKKTVIFFTSVPTLFMLALAADRFTGGLLFVKIHEILGGLL
jgi:membrane protease YdiL (CAAX protease family)/cbb3-type cytochrome oxidase subunit 3